MNICFYVKAHDQIKGGIERLASRLGNHLSTKHNITLIIDSEKWEKFPYSLSEKIFVVKLPFRSDYFFIKNLRSIIIAREIDIVVVMRTGGNPIQIFAAAMRDLRCKLVLSEHCAPEFAEREYPQHSRNLAIKCADYVHLLQDEFIKSIPEYIHNRVRVIGNFVDIDLKNIPGYKERKNHIVMIGRLTKTQKRPFLLLEAFSNLKEIDETLFNRWTLFFCGDGPEKSLIDKFIKEKKLSNVKLLGQVENVIPVLLESKFFCLPSAYEGQSIALLEAMRCGSIPIVCDDAPGNVSMIKPGETGYIVNRNNFSQDLANLLESDLNDQISQNTLQEALKFTPELILDKWVEFFNDIKKTPFSYRESHLFSRKKAMEILINKEIFI